MAADRLNEKIEFVAASAGTGKTHRLVEVVAEAVCAGEVRPEGVIATTFTKAAAAELQDRLARHLHETGHHREALRLGQALIGTVHGVCLDLLTRFAFDAGLPPEIRVLEESEAALLLTLAINETISEAETLTLLRLSDRLGQKDDRTDSYRWEDRIRTIVSEARSNDIDFDRLPAMGNASWEEMQALLPAATGDDLDALLARAIGDALAAMPEVPATKKSQDYRRLLRESRQQLSRTLSWAEWLKLSREEPAKADRADSDRVREIAARHPEHPGFHANLQTWLMDLFGIAARVGERFQALKRQRGVADFVDLEKETLDLLRNCPSVREALTEEIELLVVDEFQDTSPIQLALFFALGACARRVVWVGDVKQSIYGFRRADPALVSDAVRCARTPGGLQISWRSIPDLVALANALFPRPFAERIGLPESETVLTAYRSTPREGIPSLEISSLSSGITQKNGKPKPLTKDQKPGVLAQLAASLLDRADPVIDRASVTPENRAGKARPMRPGDLAVLVRTNDRAVALAESLRRRGIDVVIAGAGLLGTPECRLALACFRRLLDSGDSLATTEIISFENRYQPEEWLEQRIRFVRQAAESATGLQGWALDGDLISPAVAALEDARQTAGIDLLSPLQRFDLACTSAEVPRIAASWGRSAEHAAQRLANLEQLREVVAKYEKDCAQFGIPATDLGLFAVLGNLEQRGDDKRAAAPTPDAVHVSTYHAAKGLEWPVVIAADLDTESRTRLFDLRVASIPTGAVNRAENPLAGRELRLWVNPYGRAGAALVEAMETSPVGLAATRSAEDEELRLLYVGLTRARDRLILPIAAGLPHPWLETLGNSSATILARSSEPTITFPGAESLAVSRSSFSPIEDPSPASAADSIPFPIRADHHTARLPGTLVPSAMDPVAGAVVGEILEFGERLTLRGSPDERDLGESLHRILAAEIANPVSDAAARESRVRGIIIAFGLQANVQAADVLKTVDRYRAFIREHFAPASERVEVPFTFVNQVGQRVSGFIDHLLETANGPVIIDHKIFPGRRDLWEETALRYSGQLAVYAEAVGSKRSPKTVIHLVTAAALLFIR